MAGEKDVLPYARVDEWFYDQRRLLRKAIRENENFSIVMDTELNVLNTLDRRSMFRPVGKGKVTIDREGITYDGEKNGESTHFTIPIRETWGASNLHNHLMAIVHDNEPIAFDIINNASQHIIKACGAVEEFHALINEQWDAGLQRVYS